MFFKKLPELFISLMEKIKLSIRTWSDNTVKNQADNSPYSIHNNTVGNTSRLFIRWFGGKKTGFFQWAKTQSAIGTEKHCQ